MKYYLLAFAVLIFAQNMVLGQEKAIKNPLKNPLKEKDMAEFAALEDSLLPMAKMMVTDSIDGNRQMASGDFLTVLRNTLNLKNSFFYDFEKLSRYVSFQKTENNEVRLVTFQLEVQNDEYKYFGFIQNNRNRTWELKDNSLELQRSENDILTPENWLGALYYNLKMFKAPSGQTQYLLFGLNLGNREEKFKVADVLSFRSGEPRFGSPVFTTEKVKKMTKKGKKAAKKSKNSGKDMTEKQNRIILFHAATAAMRLNYDEEMKMIVHDHLTPVSNGFVPDGTLEAYELQKGIWQHLFVL